MNTFSFTILAVFCLASGSEWAPLGAEFVVPPECAGRAVQDPNLTCPPGWTQYGTRIQDVKDCGMTHCFSPGRFDKATIQDCANYCAASNGCALFSYAPECGDENHYLHRKADGSKGPTTVCTLHNANDMTINDDYMGPNQIMCVPAPQSTIPPPAPQGPCGQVVNAQGAPAAASYGFPNEDVKDCGQLNCFSGDRFNKRTLQECYDYCDANNCLVFTFAEPGGDENHPNDYVCTTHGPNDITINSEHGPNQTMCRNLRLLGADVQPKRAFNLQMTRFAKQNGLKIAGAALMSLAAVAYVVMKRRQKPEYEMVLDPQNEDLI
eukprot:CAMPEP_0114660514 /NCGR_PEP_ID=MMETSP0191-20121206/20237_1 /TAXON_ID=126664 /ORGANISM="Sorites sp." /LENGTH=321 /DNA_ID=CAMNT_0001889439 /DNA_START=51 /DNA_END=1016 /DNA_ORIENTATION=+